MSMCQCVYMCVLYMPLYTVHLESELLKIFFILYIQNEIQRIQHYMNLRKSNVICFMN